MKKSMIMAAILALGVNAFAERLEVRNFEHYGPYRLFTPLMVDSVDVNGKTLASPAEAVTPPTLSTAGKSHTVWDGAKLPVDSYPAVNILSFDFENTSYTSPALEIKGIPEYTVYLDGKKVERDRLSLRPQTHSIAIRYVSRPEDADKADSLSVVLAADDHAGFSLRSDGKRRYTLNDVLHGDRITRVEMSPDGKYLITGYATTSRGGGNTYRYNVRETGTGRIVGRSASHISWMPAGSSYYFTRRGVEGNDIVTVDAATGKETVAVRSVPDVAGLEFTPDGRFLIMSVISEGRKEDPGVYQVLEPEDRQPGWRDRNGIAIYDLSNGVTAPVTFGNRNVYLQDIAPDSRHLLLSVSESRLSKRPTTLFSLYSLNLDTMQADTLVSKDGFIGSAVYSPDGKKILLSGSPEALDGIGKNLPSDRIPSMTDQQLYIIDIATKQTRPMTRDFDPSVGSFRWSRVDGRVYFTAEDRDEVGLFRLDPNTGKIVRISLPEELVSGFSVPDTGNVMAWYGESASSPSSLYLLDIAKSRSTRLETPKEEMLADVKLGKCEPWDFVNSRGDTICGRFYLPPDFDPSVKYPMIVNYYGGCSPTERTFESRYPHHAYAAQGYVVYVIEPSGATGFGQEFSSRHVNTAGKGVADDIIEGTKEFCRQHPWVDDEKIGCIGASYGGFMTQYLQTVTDIFAAAISHAGISDHTSYWGEGYWGYSYSEVSMADSYPWSNPDLYVKQSPLFNADKIHTPLLFLHGDKDNNVPVGESIQMFTALKLLDRPTAFVAVADQDHHILDYEKRQKWQDTIFAWFAKHLKDDPTWWEALYPATPL